MAELVSVIIPCHNSEKTLDACLNSVLGQDWPALQVIAVDDGSTDGTAALLQARAQKDPRLQVIVKPNGGVSTARNAGIPEARGSYVCFVDSDDAMEPGAIRLLVEKAVETGAQLVIAGFIEDFHGIHPRNLANTDRVMNMDEVLDFYAVHANSFFCGVLWNKLFRRDLLQGLSFKSGLNWGEDFLFVTQYLQRCQKVAFRRECVYRYIRRASGMTVQQVLDCVIHPMKNIRMKRMLYEGLKDLYRAQGAYDRFKNRLWLYLIRVTLNN